MKKLGCLDTKDLNQDLLSILTERHKIMLSCMSGVSGNYAYTKLLHEILWQFELEVIEDMIVFFALQEMYEFADLMNKAIEIKTLAFCINHIGINWR